MDLVDKVQSLLGGKITGVRESAPGEPEFRTTPEHVLEVLKALKSLEGGPFDHLQDLTAYDEHPKSPRYHVTYILISMLRKQRCLVVVDLDDANPAIPTVTGLWKGANWLEREVWDMYGIHFVGHPDPRRILMPDAFKGHPLRKDFLVDYRQQFPETSEENVPSWDPFGTTVVKKPGE
jgi:NADH-quinone oxidoreductase subunit C